MCNNYKNQKLSFERLSAFIVLILQLITKTQMACFWKMHFINIIQFSVDSSDHVMKDIGRLRSYNFIPSWREKYRVCSIFHPAMLIRPDLVPSSGHCNKVCKHQRAPDLLQISKKGQTENIKSKYAHKMQKNCTYGITSKTSASEAREQTRVVFSYNMQNHLNASIL